MTMDLEQELGQELGILQRLGSGRSIEVFQQNVLNELRSVIQWDRAIPTSPELETFCPSGLWQFSEIPCNTWQAWCEAVTQAALMKPGLLLILNSPDRASFGLLLLRRDRIFEDAEVQTLSQIQIALQALLDQSTVLDRLMQPHQSQEGIPLDCANTEIASPSDHPEVLCEQRLLQLGLTPRQAEVIHLMMKGKETSSIALDLGCREATVRKHLENLYRRLGVQTRTAAIAHILGEIGVV
jgi:DNA-binding CsgD family transcriptional regulator